MIELTRYPEDEVLELGRDSDPMVESVVTWAKNANEWIEGAKADLLKMQKLLQSSGRAFNFIETALEQYKAFINELK